MFDISDIELKKELNSIFDSKKIYYSSITYDLLFDLEDHKKMEIIEFILKSTQIIYSCFDYIEYEEYMIEKYGKEPNIGKPIFNIEQLKKLKSICLNKINDNNIKKNLLLSNHFPYILHIWKEWSDEKDCEKYVKDLIKYPKIFIQFLEQFCYRRKTEKGYNIEVEYIFNAKDIESFLDLELMKQKISAIKKDESVLYESKQDFFEKIIERTDAYLNSKVQ
ncbi:MAG: hypothetical protein K8S23_15785 [Candidatus Cloacimonetes bacterium]|nr:hypothetical protein [Candidatus Cloacimonadota bacterium]